MTCSAFSKATRRVSSRSAAIASRSAAISACSDPIASSLRAAASAACAARSSLKAASEALCIATTASHAWRFSSLSAASSVAESSCAFLSRASSRSLAAACAADPKGPLRRFSDWKKTARSSSSRIAIESTLSCVLSALRSADSLTRARSASAAIVSAWLSRPIAARTSIYESRTRSVPLVAAAMPLMPATPDRSSVSVRSSSRMHSRCSSDVGKRATPKCVGGDAASSHTSKRSDAPDVSRSPDSPGRSVTNSAFHTGDVSLTVVKWFGGPVRACRALPKGASRSSTS